MILTITTILIIISISYILVLLAGSIVIQLKKNRTNHIQPKVSIVLCARNEETVLPKTLSCFELLDYPKDKLEFILVDHDSSDSTKLIFDEFVRQHPNSSKAVTIPDEVQGLLGKAAPWHCGMLESTGEVILTTGADCFVPPQWVKISVSYFLTDTQIVSGPAMLMRNNQKNSLLDRMQNLDLLFVQGMGYAVNSLGLGGAGLANNFAIKRDAYFATGGFPKLGFSICEDVRLSQGILKRYGLRSIQFHFDKDAIPITDPEPVRKLPNMKLRWSMGTRRLGYGAQIVIAITFFIHLLLPILCLLSSHSFLSFLILAVLLSEVIFTYSTTSLVKRKIDLVALPLFLPYFWIYTTVVSPWVIFRIPLNWKGLRVREPKI